MMRLVLMVLAVYGLWTLLGPVTFWEKIVALVFSPMAAVGGAALFSFLVSGFKNEQS